MIDYDAVIAAESQRFADTIADAAPGSPVPACPDWDVDDLAWHLTEVHGFWARVLTSGAATEEEVEAAEAAKPERPATREETLALFATETEALLDALQARTDSDPAWFWLDTDQTVGATRTMQAHEATMHRVDAEAAAGVPSAPIDPALAADGVRQAFEVMWAWWGTNPGFVFVPIAEPVELIAADTGDRWLAQPGRWQGVGQSGKSYDEPGAQLVDEATPGATVTGTAEGLMRWLWGRDGEPPSTGSVDALTALRAVRDAGMP